MQLFEATMMIKVNLLCKPTYKNIFGRKFKFLCPTLGPKMIVWGVKQGSDVKNQNACFQLFCVL